MIELPERAASLHITTVILWTNGMVMVFDDAGQQMPEFQGEFERVAPLINAVFRGAWEYGDWGNDWVIRTPWDGRRRRVTLHKDALINETPYPDSELSKLLWGNE